MTGSSKQPEEFPENESLEELRMRIGEDSGAKEESSGQQEAAAQEAPPSKESPKKESIGRQIWLFFRPAVICCTVILLINQLFILYAIVPTGSMQPLLQPDSFILANRRAYDRSSPQRGDVIVFETDQSTSSLLVKRVVAVAGDTLELKNGDVYLNGVRQDESAYAIGRTYPNLAGDTFTVPEGCVLVFGDNRENSADARYWNNPYLPVNQIKGRVFFAFSFKDWYARGVSHLAKHALPAAVRAE